MLEGLTITAIELTPEACSDIIETAIAAGHVHGFGYWADLVEAKEEDGKYLSLTVCDQESGDFFTPDHAKLRAAVLAMLRDPKACGCRGLIPQMLGEDELDGPLAEAIIQVACFGNVVYG